MNTEIRVWLSPEDRRTGTRRRNWSGDRAIVLLSAARVETMSIAREVGKSKPTVWRWQERYMAQGIAGLKRDASRPERKPPLAPEVIAQVVDKTLHEKPPALNKSLRRPGTDRGVVRL
jgi:hypothetical protein